MVLSFRQIFLIQIDPWKFRYKEKKHGIIFSRFYHVYCGDFFH